MDILSGYKTYIALLTLAIYNVALPLLEIKNISTEQIDIAVNTGLLILAAIFRKMGKKEIPKI